MAPIKSNSSRNFTSLSCLSSVETVDDISLFTTDTKKSLHHSL